MQLLDCSLFSKANDNNKFKVSQTKLFYSFNFSDIL